ncbi:MAG: phage head closure protein [Candidatus Thiodiazotropha sp. (ex Ctena orbiculata)]|nr:phage head closure protein [Candidatus Thiodiazotropha taylori]
MTSISRQDGYFPSMGIISGRLKYRIQIQQPDVNRSTAGEPVKNWVKFAEVRADIYDINGREFFGANQVNSEVTTKIVMRFKKGITPDMRVIHGTDIYQIVAVLNQSNSRQPTMLLCKR